MASRLTNKVHKQVICPFCSLLCDDLTVENNNDTLKVVESGCATARQRYHDIQAHNKARIKGKETSIETALEHAAKILKQSRRPLISGLGTDVNGVRAAIKLAETTAGYIDHMGSTAAMRNHRVLQDKGYILTTLAEVKNRADLVIFAGTDLSQGGYDRFYERYLWNEHSMFDLDTHDRNIVFIGEGLKTKSGISPNGKAPQVIRCPQQQVGEMFGLINARLQEQPLNNPGIGKSLSRHLDELIEKIQQASYAVVIWSPADLNFPHAELTIQSITEFIKLRNIDSRCGGLSIGGNDGGITAANVCTWQSGYPFRVSYQKGHPEFDIDAYSTETLLNNGGADAMLWISAFGSTSPPPKTRLPSIILADSSSAISREPDVFIPVGTTGLDHGGQMMRTDGVVSMTLSPVRNSRLPSVHDIVMALETML